MISTSYSSTDLVGSDLLDLLTGGLYADPLVMYREYIQNAADSIEMLSNPQDGQIDIEIDTVGRNIKIRDNGPGLTHQQAVEALISISKSNKDSKRNRGFRGIGRMCGLAFAKSVSFRTRTSADNTVAVVIWDGEALRECVGQNFSIADTVARCVTIEQQETQDAPANFFEVEITGVSRQAAIALNRVAVKDYIGEIGPVPFSEDFPYRIEVAKLFDEQLSMLEIDMRLVEKAQEPCASNASITRPHSTDALSLIGKAGGFAEYESIRVPSQSGGGLAAIGWIAHTHYPGALPRSLGVRCLRVRVGNIQVGDALVFDHLFSETRFNRWCIGEIHVLDSELVPNGSRDYFELNVHLRNLENHVRQVCRKIERQCRIASRYRNQLRKISSFAEDVEAVLFLASGGFLPDSEANRLVSHQKDKISAFSQTSLLGEAVDQQNQLSSMRNKLDSIQENMDNKLATMSDDEQRVYRNVFHAVAETSPSLSKAKETIESIMKFHTGEKAESPNPAQ